MAWVAVAVASLLLLSFVPMPAFVTALDPLSLMNKRNAAMLSEAIRSNALDLALFTEALAVLNVTSSTDVGVALIVKADVKIGDALTEARDLIEHAQGITLAAGVVLQVLRILSDIAMLVGPVAYRAVLVMLLLALGAAWFFNRGAAHVISLDILRIVLLLYLGIKMLIPLALFLSGALVSGLDLHTLLTSESAAHDLASSATSAMQGKDVVAHWGEGSNVKAGLNSLHETFQAKATGAFRYVTGLLVFHLMHGIVFPLLVFAVIWKVARLSVNHVFLPSIASINAERRGGTV